MDKTLYFMRHATAELRQPDVADRPRQLILKGQRQAEKVATWLLQQQITPSLVLCSPYPRATQTAQIVCDTANLPNFQQVDWLAIDTPTETALSALWQLVPSLPSDTLLVGHEPDFSQLIATLIGATSPALRIKKASVCCVKLHLQTQQAQLQWLLPVQLM